MKHILVKDILGDFLTIKVFFNHVFKKIFSFNSRFVPVVAGVSYSRSHFLS